MPFPRRCGSFQLCLSVCFNRNLTPTTTTSPTGIRQKYHLTSGDPWVEKRTSINKFAEAFSRVAIGGWIPPAGLWRRSPANQRLASKLNRHQLDMRIQTKKLLSGEFLLCGGYLELFLCQCSLRRWCLLPFLTRQEKAHFLYSQSLYLQNLEFYCNFEKKEGRKGRRKSRAATAVGPTATVVVLQLLQTSCIQLVYSIHPSFQGPTDLFLRMQAEKRPDLYICALLVASLLSLHFPMDPNKDRNSA